MDAILRGLGDGPLVFNLGHGITPETPIEHVEEMVARVRKGMAAMSMNDSRTAAGGSSVHGTRSDCACRLLALVGIAVFCSDPDNFYLWIKAIHVIAVISWMAGMLYLPRLFVYHAEVGGRLGAVRDLQGAWNGGCCAPSSIRR